MQDGLPSVGGHFRPVPVLVHVVSARTGPPFGSALSKIFRFSSPSVRRRPINTQGRLSTFHPSVGGSANFRIAGHPLGAMPKPRKNVCHGAFMRRNLS